MARTCPECDGLLTELEPGAEMGSQAARYECPYCEVKLERDASGMLFEVED